MKVNLPTEELLPIACPAGLILEALSSAYGVCVCIVAHHTCAALLACICTVAVPQWFEMASV